MTTSRIPSSKRLPHEVWEQGTSRGIRIGDWEVETRKKAIVNASEIEEAAERLDIPLPEITFGNNLVSLKRKGKQRASDDDAPASTSSSITFNGLDALAQVDTTGDDTIKVSYADKWAKSRNLEGGASGTNDESTAIIETVKNYDWTYSTRYSGTCEGDISFRPAQPDHPGIPLSRLARQDEPILFFDEVTLFEDELHDNGVANLTVRIRVMPSGLFLLSRFFLRVDNVLFRIYDVRLYHDFTTGEMIRETKGKEAPYEAVKKKLPRERADDMTPLTDHNWVANVLGMLQSEGKRSGINAASVTSSLQRGGASTHAPGSAMGGSGSTAAPWAQNRRQGVSSNIALPDRITGQGVPMPARVNASKEANEPAKLSSLSENDASSQLHGAKRQWPGLGRSLQVFQLE